MVKSDEQEGKKRESLITADGQIIIVLREELRRAQVDRRGGESRGNTPLEQKENNISPLSFPPLSVISPERRRRKRAVAGREFCLWLKMSLCVLLLL